MLSVHDPEWDKFGWPVPWMAKECQPDREAAIREDQAQRLLEQCDLKSIHLGDQEALELVTSTERKGQTNG